MPRAAETSVAARRAGGLVCAALLVSIGVTLSRSPCLGVADNGDYWRVMRPAGIEHVEPLRRPGRFVQCEYRAVDGDLVEGLSSPAVVAWLARQLSREFGDGSGNVDLRSVGVLYVIILAAIVAFALIRRASPLLVAAWLYVLADPGFFLFFNSFYADPALLVAVLGVALWFVTADVPARLERPTLGALVSGAGLVLIVLLGGASKMQYVLVPVAALLALGSLAPRRVGRVSVRSPGGLGAGGIVASLGALGILAVVLPWLFFRGPAPRFLRVNNYHAVFAGILQVTDAPERAVDRLGISRDYLDLPRRDVWSGKVPLDHPVFEELEDLSRWRLLGLYLTEPSAMARSLDRLTEAFASESPHRRGNFPRSASRPAYAQVTVPWQFSRFRHRLLAPWRGAIWLVPAGAAIWLTLSIAKRRWGGRQAAALFLLAFGGSQLAVVVLGDGFVALEQHLVGARFAFDLLLVLGLYTAVEAGWRRLRWARRRRSRVIDSAAGQRPERSP